jgi:hypothetical protein
MGERQVAAERMANEDGSAVDTRQYVIDVGQGGITGERFGVVIWAR